MILLKFIGAHSFFESALVNLTQVFQDNTTLIQGLVFESPRWPTPELTRCSVDGDAAQECVLKSFPSNFDTQPRLEITNNTLTLFTLMPSFTVIGILGGLF